MMNKTQNITKTFIEIIFVLPLIAVIMLAFRNNEETITTAISNTQEEYIYVK